MTRFGQVHEQALGEVVEAVGKEQDAHFVYEADAVYQQMRGNCSPLSQSTTRYPPMRVFICTKQ